MSKLPANPVTDLRVDQWLWAARFFKTRSLAKQAIDGGRIDVNDAGCKPAKALIGASGPLKRPDKHARRDLRRLKDAR